MIDPIVNFFSSTLVGTYSASDTSLTIATGSGELLPDPSVDGAFNLVIYNESAIGVVTTYDGGSTDTRQDLAGTNPEIVRVTARSGDVLTVTRGQEGTTASVKEEGNTYRVILSATKKTFDDINTAIANVDLTTLTNVEELTFDSTGDEEFGLPAGTTAQRPSSPSAGYMRWNSTDSRVEVYTGTRWAGLSEIGLEQVSLGVAELSVTANDAVFEAVATFLGNRGIFGGGVGVGSYRNNIEYVSIDTTGNGTDFGDLSKNMSISACSNGTRGVFMGGYGGSPGSETVQNLIEYITIATTGNSTDFGDLSASIGFSASCSDGSRGLNGGGSDLSNNLNVIDYITIDTTGNAQDFGDLTQARGSLNSCASSVRGVFAGGGGPVNTIDYVTIATTGNATDFGDLTSSRDNLASCSDGNRGIFAGGRISGSGINNIEYITIATTGNATDFGDLTVARWGPSASSNGTRAIIGGGYTGSDSNVIDYVTIQTTGNATDFGDLTLARRLMGACSGD